MKLRVTRKGIHDQDGNPIPVGKEIEIKGDTMPAAFVNKAEAVTDSKAGKTAVTNPKKD